jgi:hypothetical protein
MSSDRRHTWGLIIDVLDVLEQHGYRQADDQHTGRAVGLISDLARIYEGTKEAPAGAYLVPTPEPSLVDRQRPAPTAAKNTGTIASAEMHTILSALSDAADYKRDQAECCADCADQSCGTCQYRLDAAQVYEGLAVRLIHAMDAAVLEEPSPLATSGAVVKRARPEIALDREAGQ